MYINLDATNPIKVRTINNLYSFGFNKVDSLTFPWIPISTSDIVYINYNGNTAKVINPYPATQVIVTVSEAKVSITSLSSENITYCLSGTANPGRFAIESTATPTIMLNGVNLTNPTGKAMDLTCDAGVILQITDGTTNALSNGTMQLNGGFCISNGAAAPEEGFDCDNNQFKITGGTHIGTGGGTSNPTASVCTHQHKDQHTQSGYAVQILNSSGTVVCTYQCPSLSGGRGWPERDSGLVMLFTDPQLSTGQTYTLKYGGTNWNGYYTGNVTYSGGQTKTFTINSMYTTVNAQ